MIIFSSIVLWRLRFGVSFSPISISPGLSLSAFAILSLAGGFVSWKVFRPLFGLSFWGQFFWGLWKERNSRIFEDRPKGLEEIFLYIYRLLFDWISICPGFEEAAWVSFW